MKSTLHVCAFIISLTMALPAFAGDSVKHFMVAARSLGFVQGMDDTIQVAILYDPALTASVDAKDAILAKIASGIRVGQKLLKAAPVDVGNLGAIKNFDAVYLTAGLSSQYQTIKKMADSEKFVTIGEDINCVRMGLCVVGAEVDSDVRVYVNNDAATSAGIVFQSSFLMLVKEL